MSAVAKGPWTPVVTLALGCALGAVFLPGHRPVLAGATLVFGLAAFVAYAVDIGRRGDQPPPWLPYLTSGVLCLFAGWGIADPMYYPGSFSLGGIGLIVGLVLLFRARRSVPGPDGVDLDLDGKVSEGAEQNSPAQE